jgi:hypothetical protein
VLGAEISNLRFSGEEMKLVKSWILLQTLQLWCQQQSDDQAGYWCRHTTGDDNNTGEEMNW